MSHDSNAPLHESIEHYCPECGDRSYTLTTRSSEFCRTVIQFCNHCKPYSHSPDVIAEGMRYALNKLLPKGAPQCKVTAPLNPDHAIGYIAGIGSQKRKP